MPPHTRSLLTSLYRTMLLIRESEEALVAPILSGEVKTPCHLYSGQEAVAAGVLAHFNSKDSVFGTHRSHGHYLAMGGSLKGMMAEIFCRETGCARGRGGSMHLVAPEKGFAGAAPIVGGTISLALGAALASNIKGEKTVAAAFFGDGATGEGAIHETLNFASLLCLPLVLVCENNLYATHMPIRACRKEMNISRLAAPYGVKAWRVDGNDVLKVHAAAKEAVAACRAGNGPVFIECLTYRFRGHVGPDDAIQGTHTDIRPAPEVKRWLKKDPITRLERKLLADKLASEAGLARIKASVKAEVDEAVAYARRSSRPAPSTMENYVFK